MNVNIQTVHFEADNKLVDYVNKKLSQAGYVPRQNC